MMERELLPKNTAEKCSEMLIHSVGFRVFACGNKAKVREGGKCYCGIHDPQKERDKRARWAKESEARNARWDAQALVSKCKADLLKAALEHPDLQELATQYREALKALEALSDARETACEQDDQLNGA